MAIAETIAGLKVLSSGLKSIGEIADTIKNAQVKHLTSEMLDKVIGLQYDILELQQENAQLKDDVRTLKDKASAKASFVFEKNYYWKVTPDGKEGPFCPGCHAKSIESRLVGEDWGHGSYYKCPTCTFHNSEGDPKYPVVTESPFNY